MLFSIQNNLMVVCHTCYTRPQLLLSWWLVFKRRHSQCQLWHAFNYSCHHSKPKESRKTCLLLKRLQLAEKKKDLDGTVSGSFPAFSHGRVTQDYEPPKSLPHSQNEKIYPLTAEWIEEQYGGSILNPNVMLQAPLLLFLHFFLSTHPTGAMWALRFTAWLKGHRGTRKAPRGEAGVKEKRWYTRSEWSEQDLATCKSLFSSRCWCLNLSFLRLTCFSLHSPQLTVTLLTITQTC